LRNLIERDATGFGEHFCGFDHVSRLVAFAAEFAGREIRCVGLNEDAVRRQLLGDRAQRIRIAKRQDAGERNEQSKRNGPTGDVQLTFLGQYTKFENYAPESYAEGVFR